jgi:ethanolamine utilization protein EutQ
MAKTLRFKRKDIKFTPMGHQGAGTAEIARLIGPDTSTSMGGGIAKFDGCAVEWTVLYDEFICVLEGRYKMKAGDQMFEGGPGDVFWIPANTPLVYMGDKATIFYTVWPVDWRKRHGME